MRLLACLLLALPVAAQNTPKPATEVFHGVAVTEDFRWLEDPDSPETRAWIREQNARTQAFLARVPQRPAIRALIEKLYQFDRYPTLGGYAAWYTRGARQFYVRQRGLENQPVLYVREGGKDRVLLDANTLSPDGTAAVNTFSISRDGRLLAYAVARAGSDWVTWRVRDVATGKDLSDTLEWSKFSGAEWDAKGEGFWYGRYPEAREGDRLRAVNENFMLCYHRIGTPQAEDQIVYRRPDQPRWSFTPHLTSDGRYLVLEIAAGTAVERQIHFIDLQSAERTPRPVISEFRFAYRFAGSRGSKIYLLTNDEAPRYRVIEVDLLAPERARWRTVVAEAEDTLRQARVAGNELVLNYMRHVSGLVKVVPLAGGPARTVPLPQNSSITLAEDSSTIFSVTNFTTPETLYRCEAEGCRPLFPQKLPFDPAKYETRQEFAASRDGTRVPVYITLRKGLPLDGSHPAILYGYGGFNISVTPSFSAATMAWLERGGVYASANLRGGGEYGEPWHRAGMKQNKQNVFDDFIAVAEHLIARGYTNSRKLAIRGGSNGGLLVGAVLNQRPELFAAAVPAVGVMDMLRFDRFTIGHAWTSEYGSPSNPEEFRVLYSYSPLHNIRPGTAYPATLVLTADHDDRVVPAHSFKYAATLQNAQGGEAPVLIRIETAAGHGAGKPTSKIIDEAADVLAFLEAVLFPEPQPKMYRVHIDQDRLAGAPDFSFLNRPLTSEDRIRVRDGHFVDARGRRVKFWGVNLAFGGNFPEPADAVRIARRLRRLGVNLVRLHHMDTSPDADPGNARSLLTTGPYPTLNPVSVQRLRTLLDALREEGIYVNLNLHVGYTFRPGIDTVPDPGYPIPAMSKPVHILNERMVELQCEYARKVIEALRLKDDPVLAMVEINNESSLLYSWQTGALKKYWPEATLEEVIARDKAYLDRIAAAVREALGAPVPITGTQIEFGGPFLFDTHASLDYIDEHFYIDHYNFPNRPWDQTDWRIRDSSGAGSGYLQYLHKAFARQANKPYTVSEFNQPYPNRQAAELDPTFAAFAAFQDWDGVMHFAYSHGRNWDRNAPSGFDLDGDFTKLAAFGQAAYIFRKGLVRPAPRELVVPLPRALREKATAERMQFQLARFFESIGVDPNTAFTRRVAVDPTVEASPQTVKEQPPYRAEDGDITYDPLRQLFLIHAEQAAGVFGFVLREPATAGPMTVTLGPDARGFASILLTALDGKPLESSARLLLTNPGFTLGESQRLVRYRKDPAWFTLAPADTEKPSSPFSVSGPVKMELVDATVVLKSKVAGLTVYPLDSSGRRQAAIPVEKTPQGYRFRLNAETPWYEITTNRPLPGGL
ncbi:MAG: prolyl oligopeptidase family serine peptidase [Bryobacteraceae bacterium]|nr:prolyl oligopeptidase family serine peptidase [Bryobacteraceae bacterium]